MIFLFHINKATSIDRSNNTPSIIFSTNLSYSTIVKKYNKHTTEGTKQTIKLSIHITQSNGRDRWRQVTKTVMNTGTLVAVPLFAKNPFQHSRMLWDAVICWRASGLATLYCSDLWHTVCITGRIQVNIMLELEVLEHLNL